LNPSILLDKTQQFINQHLHDDLTKLFFKKSPFSDITIQELANQILAKNKSEKKLPTWFQLEKCYFPNKVSIEQTSSEITAEYKSKLVSGNTIIDITGGFGVDSYYFSKVFKTVIHCEIEKKLSKIVDYNFNQLKVKNIQFVSKNGIHFLKENNVFFDWIYIDPSRRNDEKEKVFLLKDCTPNVYENLDFLLTMTNQILIKTSPILDISSTIKELKFVKEIHVVAVQNEVKELLYILEKNYISKIKILTVNILKDYLQEFQFYYKDHESIKYSLPLTYLYEPNAAILKSGGFEKIASQMPVFKLHKHTHLFTSDEIIDFPGRIFKVESVKNYDKKLLKKFFPDNKANVTVRNFPKSVAQIRKETSLKDGGNFYIFFITDLNDNLKVIICKKKLTYP
jgi:16S rRNA G966 N2-methylase RsmD